MNRTWLDNLEKAVTDWYSGKKAVIHAFLTAILSAVVFEAYSELSTGKADFDWTDLKKAGLVAATAWLVAYFKTPPPPQGK